MAEFKYEIKKAIGLLSKNGVYSKEINIISYNGGADKIDIRNWSEQEDGNKRMGKGITLTLDETKCLELQLKKAIQYFEDAKTATAEKDPIF